MTTKRFSLRFLECIPVSPFVTHLSFVVGGHAAHVVVHRGQHGDGLLGDVHPGEDHGRLRDARQPGGQLLGREVVQLEVDVVLIGSHPPEREKA